MEEVKSSLQIEIQFMAKKFLEFSKDKEIQIISHFDTDGISSATILLKTLKKLDKKFSIKILKNLEEDFIKKLDFEKINFFLDLGSGSLNHFEKINSENIFILDHHEIVQKIPEKINIVNPEIIDKQKISSSGLTYLFCKEISKEYEELSKLAILGMIGDNLEKEISKENNLIIEEGNIKRKRGLMIYPSTRPINRTLEFSSHPFIPGITGNQKGVIELLREINFQPENGQYKSLIELDEEEMQKLITSITTRIPSNPENLIGDIFLLKMFNRLEDARELSTMINACSRLGHHGIALQLCMEKENAKKTAESIYVKYKQLIVSGLKFATESEKIQGKGFVIINAKNQIKDTMIGTILSIISHSQTHEEGTIIIGMANNLDKIKISARIAGKKGRNVREVLAKIIDLTGGEVGGHEAAAGCTIPIEKEQEFIEFLKKHLEIEMIKI